MLKGISPLISPELMINLMKMGHGDEIIFADAHFPGYTFNNNVIRADGLPIADLLKGVLTLFELDTYVDHPIAMMSPVPGDELDPTVEESYMAQIAPIYPNASLERIERFDFYERTKGAFVVVITGETAKYGNILLKKGVTPLN